MVDVKKPWKSSVGKSSKVLKSAMCAETFSIDVIRPKLSYEECSFLAL